MEGKCPVIGPKVHVYDLAGKPWLFPRIAALARNESASALLRGLMPDMLRPNPDDRPSLDGLLRAIPEE